MIYEVFQYLGDSPVSDRTFTYERDDDRTPFSDTSKSIVLVSQQPGEANRDITRSSFDLMVFTPGNPEASVVGQLMEDMRLLEQWIVANYKQDRIYNIEVVGGVAGPNRDGQGRRFASLTIRASGTTGHND